MRALSSEVDACSLSHSENKVRYPSSLWKGVLGSGSVSTSSGIISCANAVHLGIIGCEIELFIKYDVMNANRCTSRFLLDHVVMVDTRVSYPSKSPTAFQKVKGIWNAFRS